MKFEIDIIEDVDQKQFNYHIKKIYDQKIKSIIHFEGKVKITAEITSEEKADIEEYYASLEGGLFEADYAQHVVKNSYLQKQSDGIDYYNEKRSEQVLMIMIGQNTSEDAFNIHLKTSQVKSSLLTGDWITAYREFNVWRVLPFIHGDSIDWRRKTI